MACACESFKTVSTSLLLSLLESLWKLGSCERLSCNLLHSGAVRPL